MIKEIRTLSHVNEVISKSYHLTVILHGRVSRSILFLRSTELFLHVLHNIKQVQ